MAVRLDISSNGLPIDYERLEGLPFSLNIQTDSYLDLVGSLGIKLDNIAKQIFFPGTKNNRAALAQVQNPATYSPTVRDAQPLLIQIDGASVFNGKYAPKQVAYESLDVKGFTAELIGGTADFFSSLQGLNLNQLSLGEVLYTTAAIQQSWNESYDTGWAAVFAPVIYKELDNVSGTNVYQWDHFRPSVYFRSILDAIAAHVNVTFVSSLFDTDYFKRHVYLFGVGGNWKSGASANNYFRVSSNVGINATTVWSPLGLADETTAPNQDPSNVWNGSQFTSPGQNVYNFYGEIASGQNASVRFVTSTGLEIPLFPGQPFSIEGVELAASETAQIEIILTDITNNVGFISFGSYLEGVGSATPVIGGSIDVASCLHSLPVLDFLRGISHLFNLAWAYDPVTREVYVDPRFDFKVDGNQYRGFYHNPNSLAVNEVPKDWTEKLHIGDIKAEYVHPFGRYLQLKNIPEDSFIGKRARAAGSSSVPFLSARLPFGDLGKKGQTKPNPFFEDLVLLDGNVNIRWMPIVVPDYDPEQGLPVEADATYESEPKYGFYAGNIDYNSWRFEGEASSTVTRPALYQRPPNNLSFAVPGTGSYSDYISGGTIHRGYASTFYATYYQTLLDALTFNADVELSNTEIQDFPIGFRRMRRAKIGDNYLNLILIEIKGFAPLRDGPTQVKLIKYSPPDQSTFGRIIHNQQNSAVSISGI